MEKIINQVPKTFLFLNLKFLLGPCDDKDPSSHYVQLLRLWLLSFDDNVGPFEINLFFVSPLITAV